MIVNDMVEVYMEVCVKTFVVDSYNKCLILHIKA